MASVTYTGRALSRGASGVRLRAIPAAIWAPLLIYGSAGLVLFMTWLFAEAKGKPISYLTWDRAQAAQLKFYAGYLSHFGVVVLIVMATLTIHAAMLVTCPPRAVSRRTFLMVSGALTAWLAIDDLFLVHDGLLTRLVSDASLVTIAFYAGIAGAYVFAFRKQIDRKARFYAIAALTFAAASLIIDLASDYGVAAVSDVNHIYEDGAKFFAIVSWAAFLWVSIFRYSRQSLREVEGGVTPARRSGAARMDLQAQVPVGPPAGPEAAPR